MFYIIFPVLMLLIFSVGLAYLKAYWQRAKAEAKVAKAEEEQQINEILATLEEEKEYF